MKKKEKNQNQNNTQPSKQKEAKETKKEDSPLDEIDLNNINIDNLLNSGEPENTPTMKVSNVAENVEKINEAANIDDIETTVDLVKYMFASNEEKPIILERLRSDGDARIKEISTINALQTQLNITKLSSLEQTILDDIIKSVENSQFLSLTDKINVFTTINTAKEKAQKQIFDYIKMARDFNSMPTIYRQLVDKLMIMPDDKIRKT